MKQIRHQVRRIHPQSSATFDGQFWPVLMAIFVVAAIAAGAIVSLLHGTMMWVSLLLLPVVSIAAIVLLYRLEDSVLRRSLQLAILLSLGIHLLILMVSSLLTIFVTAAPEQTAKLIRKPERRIVVSNRSQQLIIHQTHKQPTPDTPVETEKTQTNPRTQAREVPTVRQEQPQERQISQLRKEQPVVPRKEQRLSERKRNLTEHQPISSAGQVSIRSTSKPASSAKPSSPPIPTKTEITKQPTASSSIAKAKASSEASSQPTHRSNLRRRSSRNSPVKDSKATARSRRETVAIPKVATRATLASQNKVAEKSLVAKSTQLDVKRQSTTSNQPTKSSSTVNQARPKQLEQTSARRVSSRARNSVKNQRIAKTVDRTIAAKTPTTQTNLQPVRRSVASNNTSRNQPQPKSFAVTRSEQGSFGAGKSSNLERLSGGAPSPVQIASDSSHQRPSNLASENVSLSSLQKSTRMDRGMRSQSQRVLKANTSAWAQRTGSRSPASKSIQAAAAALDSSLSRERGEMATEKGSSMMDVGATKVVTETTAQRRGGGGSPDLSDSMTRQKMASGGRTTNNELKSESEVRIDRGQLASADASQITTGDGQIADFESRVDSQIAETTTSRDQVAVNEGGSNTIGSPQAMSKRRDGQATTSSAIASDNLVMAVNSRDGNTRADSATAASVSQDLNFGSASTRDASIGTVALGNGDSGDAESIERRENGTGQASKGVARFATDAADDGSSDVRASELSRREGSSALAATASDQLGSERSDRQTQAAPSAGSQVSLNPTTGQESNVIQGQLSVVDSKDGEIGRQDSAANRSEAGMKLDIDAEDGAAGLANVASRRAGTLLDASIESDQLSPQRESRFTRKESGGSPSVVPNVAFAKEAFRKRNPAALASSGPSTEAAIELGLAFLARNQLADGSWTLGQFDRDDPLFQNQLSSDTAATGLALLAFQGAGYNHREYKYAAQVKAAIDWLIKNQTADGGLFVESDKKSNSSCRMYSHAIAALALTEAYGMTQDDNILEATQRALDYIANTQDPEKGGWRYYATRNMRSSDTSVTGWMMMALKSGHLAGLDTSETTLNGIARWLGVAQAPDSPHEFRYNPYATDSPGVSRAHGREVSTTMTSVGLLMKVYSGWKPDDVQFLNGVNRLLTQLPGDQNSRQRDTYYWYYATQVLKHAGGDYWEQWRSALHPLLITSQVKNGEMAGSWHPYKPVPDRWAPQGGRLYVTTMNLLSLEVRYRLLPLYEKTIE